MADWLSAFRYAFRTLRRQPTFVLVALLTLTLGIGANTALFSVIRAVVLNPLPYEEPEKIVVLWEVNPDGGLDRVSVPTYEDWKAEARAWSRSRPTAASISRSPDPASRMSVSGVRATPELFAVLEAGARLGRTFAARRGRVRRTACRGPQRRVLAARARRRTRTSSAGRFSSTPSRTRSSASCRRGSSSRRAADAQIWTPLTFDPKDLHGRSRRARSLMVVGRIAPAATPGQAQEELPCAGRPHRRRLQGQQRGLERAGRGRARTARGRFASRADGADGRRRISAADRLREHGESAAGAPVEPAARDRRPRRARRRTMGDGAADPGREPAVVDRRRHARLAGRRRRAAPARRAARSAAAAAWSRSSSTAASSLFTTVVSMAVAVAFGLLPALHASRGDLRDSSSESATNTAEPRSPPAAECARRGRGRARAGPARRRRADDAELLEAAAGQSGIRAGQRRRRAGVSADDEVPRAASPGAVLRGRSSSGCAARPA